MTVTWDATTYAAFYSQRIRWADANDPGNVNGERIGQSFTYGKDALRYTQRGTHPQHYYGRIMHLLQTHMLPLGLVPAQHIVVIGAGFGYLPYVFRTSSNHPQVTPNYTNCYSVERAVGYIPDNWTTNKWGVDTDPVAFVNWVNNGTQQTQDNLDAALGRHRFHFVINWVTESFQIKDPITGIENTSEMSAFNDHLDANERGLLAAVTDDHVINIVDNALRVGQSVDYVPVGERTPTNKGEHDFLVDQGTAIMSLADWKAIRATHSWFDSRSGDWL